MRWRVSLRAAGLVVVLAAAVQLHAGVMYTVTDLGTLGGPPGEGSEAHGINDLGQVVGWAFAQTPSGAAMHAFRTAPNQPINPATDDLDVLGSPWSVARGINNLGQVIGSGGGTISFRTRPNQPINPATDELGTLGGAFSAAVAINDAGQVVGQSKLADGSYRAFRTAPNAPINPATDDLGTFGGAGSAAFDINALGQVVGGAALAGNGWAAGAFRSAPNSAINPLTDDLGTLGGTWSQAFGINASGQVAGTSTISTEPGHGMHIFRTSPDQPINPVTDDLGTLGEANLQVKAMNDRGDVVGVFVVYGDVENAFIGVGSQLANLNDFIDPASGWVLKNANDINNLGQIVGGGYLNGRFRAYRLDPIPEPSALLVGVAGLSICALRRPSQANPT